MHRLYRRLQIGFWGMVCLVMLSPFVLIQGATALRQPVLSGIALQILAGATASHLCHRRLHASPRSPGWRWAIAVAAIALSMVLAGAATQSLGQGPLSMPGIGPVEAVGLYFAARTGSAVLVALSWCMGYAVVRAAGRVIAAESQRLHAEIELERQAKLAGEARLAALHARLQPHFLFNAMNTIRALIAEDPDTARRAVTDLSFLIRETLHASDSKEHPLADELHIVQRYLSLEALRFGARMRWRIDAAAADPAFALPPLLLQTLVENAVKHGVGRQVGTVDIAVRAASVDGRARIEVANTGALPAVRGDGRGLALSRERLRLLYGEDGGVSLDATADGTAVIAVAEWTPRTAGAGA
jgi:hypothetical protein